MRTASDLLVTRTSFCLKVRFSYETPPSKTTQSSNLFFSMYSYCKITLFCVKLSWAPVNWAIMKI